MDILFLGSINVDQFRYAISPEEWEELSRYFEKCFIVKVTDDLCESCYEADQVRGEITNCSTFRNFDQLLLY